MAAENSSQIESFQREVFAVQVEQAVAQAEQAAENNENLVIIAGKLDDVNAGMHDLNRNVVGVANILLQGFQFVSRQLMQQKETLDRIAEVLQRPYETKALELRKEADKWLKQGAICNGRDRDESFKDAMSLLRTTTENPIGKQDYVAWFQIGWLLWKHENNILGAEEAFYRAQRLSAPELNLWYVDSLRHMALMQYTQGKYEEAYATINKALSNDDHDTLFDAARYAAKSGRANFTEHLDKCITLRPATIVVMFAEPDFNASKEGLAALNAERVRFALERALAAIQTWQEAFDKINQASIIAGIDIVLPSAQSDDISTMKEAVHTADYLSLLVIEKLTTENKNRAIELACLAINQSKAKECSSLEAEFKKYVDGIKEPLQIAESRKRDLESQRRGIRMPTPLGLDGPIDNFPTGCLCAIGAIVCGILWPIVSWKLGLKDGEKFADNALGGICSGLILGPVLTYLFIGIRYLLWENKSALATKAVSEAAKAERAIEKKNERLIENARKGVDQKLVRFADALRVLAAEAGPSTIALLGTSTSAKTPLEDARASHVISPLKDGKSTFDVILIKVIDTTKKIAVIKAVREITGLGLKEAKDIIDKAPQPVKTGVPRAEAEAMKAKLEKEGATVEIR